MATDIPVSDLKEHVEIASAPLAVEQIMEEEDKTSLLDLLIVLVERKRTILWVTAGFAIVSIIVSLLLPIRYTATVMLLPPQQNSSLGAQLASQLGSMGGVAALATGGSLLKNPNDMYVAMLKSRTVKDAMVEHFGLMQEYHERYLSDARKKFEHYTDVDGSGKDGLIHISVEDHDPRRAADLANGYVDQFRDLSQHLAITEAGQRRVFFEQQLKQANQNLGDAEEALKETEQKTGLIQLDSQVRALIESAAALRAQITTKEVQIQGMQTYATGENAQLVEAQQELDSLRAQLAKLGGGGDATGGIIVPKGQMTQAGMEYVRRLRDVKYYETIFDILARQFELAKLDEAKEGALIQVVDPAVPPDKRSFPKRGLIVIATTVVGFFVAIFVVLFQAGLRHLRTNPEANIKLTFLKSALAFRKPAAAVRSSGNLS
ncbi:MAG: Wzz/FepE/Etk N-terminal domain-containing protein [Terracidiphilus sp.]